MSLSKNRLSQTFISAVLLVVLLLSLWTPMAKAAEEEPPIDLGLAEITGILDNGTFKLTPEAPENLFDLDGDVYPGGTWTKTVRITNDCPRSMHVSLLSVTTGDMDTTLFDALDTKILVDGITVYDGSYGAGSEEKPMTESFRIPGHASMDLEILVSLAPEYGNELQGKAMKSSTWTFGSWYDYPPKATSAEYYVYYRDVEGNDLHEMKTGKAKIGTTVKETAIEIDGYTPDAAEKSIEIQPTDSKNRITFIYSPDKDSAELPDNPSTDDPGTAEPQPGPSDNSSEVPKTGVELDTPDYNKMIKLIIGILICLIIIFRILRNEFINKGKHSTPDSAKKEADTDHDK